MTASNKLMPVKYFDNEVLNCIAQALLDTEHFRVRFMTDPLVTKIMQENLSLHDFLEDCLSVAKRDNIRGSTIFKVVNEYYSTGSEDLFAFIEKELKLPEQAMSKTLRFFRIIYKILLKLQDLENPGKNKERQDKINNIIATNQYLIAQLLSHGLMGDKQSQRVLQAPLRQMLQSTIGMNDEHRDAKYLLMKVEQLEKKIKELQAQLLLERQQMSRDEQEQKKKDRKVKDQMALLQNEIEELKKVRQQAQREMAQKVASQEQQLEQYKQKNSQIQLKAKDANVLVQQLQTNEQELREQLKKAQLKHTELQKELAKFKLQFEQQSEENDQRLLQAKKKQAEELEAVRRQLQEVQQAAEMQKNKLQKQLTEQAKQSQTEQQQYQDSLRQTQIVNERANQLQEQIKKLQEESGQALQLKQKAYLEIQEQLKQAQQAIKEQENAFKKQIAELREQLQANQGQYEDKMSQLQTANKENNELKQQILQLQTKQEQLEKNSEQAKQKNEELKRQAEESKKQLKQASEEQKQELNKKIAQLEQQKQQMQQNIMQLEETNQQLTKKGRLLQEEKIKEDKQNQKLEAELQAKERQLIELQQLESGNKELQKQSKENDQKTKQEKEKLEKQVNELQEQVKQQLTQQGNLENQLINKEQELQQLQAKDQQLTEQDILLRKEILLFKIKVQKKDEQLAKEKQKAEAQLQQLQLQHDRVQKESAQVKQHLLELQTNLQATERQLQEARNLVQKLSEKSEILENQLQQLQQENILLRKTEQQLKRTIEELQQRLMQSNKEAEAAKQQFQQMQLDNQYLRESVQQLLERLIEKVMHDPEIQQAEKKLLKEEIKREEQIKYLGKNSLGIQAGPEQLQFLAQSGTNVPNITVSGGPGPNPGQDGKLAINEHYKFPTIDSVMPALFGRDVKFDLKDRQHDRIKLEIKKYRENFIQSSDIVIRDNLKAYKLLESLCRKIKPANITMDEYVQQIGPEFIAQYQGQQKQIEEIDIKSIVEWYFCMHTVGTEHCASIHDAERQDSIIDNLLTESEWTKVFKEDGKGPGTKGLNLKFENDRGDKKLVLDKAQRISQELIDYAIDQLGYSNDIYWNYVPKGNKEDRERIENRCLSRWKKVYFDGEITELSKFMPPEKGNWKEWIGRIQEDKTLALKEKQELMNQLLNKVVLNGDPEVDKKVLEEFCFSIGNVIRFDNDYQECWNRFKQKVEEALPQRENSWAEFFKVLQVVQPFPQARLKEITNNTRALNAQLANVPILKRS